MDATPPTGFTTDVAGRKVYVTVRTLTQTVSICTPAGRRSEYEARFRLPLEAAVGPGDLPDVTTVDELRDLLLTRGATPEDDRGMPALVAHGTDDGPWLEDAVLTTEAAISYLVDEFVRHPYLHRVEHSLHARLFELLVSGGLGGRFLLSDGRTRTGLVHKEWPETEPRQDDRRGAFDLAVLTPGQLRRATVHQFRYGRVQAPIVIEMGLDYGLEHLHGDIRKVRNSDVAKPFVVHLSRRPDREQDAVEAALMSATTGQDPVRTAYVMNRGPGRTRIKRLGDSSVSTI